MKFAGAVLMGLTLFGATTAQAQAWPPPLEAAPSTPPTLATPSTPPTLATPSTPPTSAAPSTLATPATPATSAPLPTPEWYGWQILIADAAVASTWVVADRTGSGKLALLGTFGYLLATPIIHGEHDRLGAAVSSVALRLGAPLMGAFIGLLVETNQCVNPNAGDEISGFSPCEATGAEVGLFGAMIAVSIFDIARATTTPGEASWRPSRDPGPAWSPVVVPTSSGTTVGLVGRF
jgi:hypothetical protein